MKSIASFALVWIAISMVCDAGDVPASSEARTIGAGNEVITRTAATSNMDHVDTLLLGDLASEKSHAFTAEDSKQIRGGLGETARVLQPRRPTSWRGGTLAFALKVDSNRPNYATVRFWGSDATSNCLVLFCEGKQIGYRHLGDIPSLDVGGGTAPFDGRFFYVTTPLPLSLTQGKTELRFEIQSSGPIWGYGATFDKFQKEMTQPSRGIYSITTHLDPCFSPPASDRQGSPLLDPPVRSGPGSEVLEQLKARVNSEINRLLGGREPLKQMQLMFLAEAYGVKWTSAYRNEKAIERALQSLDALFVAYRKDPKLVQTDPETYNPEWFGLGPSGKTIVLLAAPLAHYLDQSIDDGRGGKISRRTALSEMLQACRDWHRRHRRLYTNQTMINDLYGIYLANRGLAVLDPARAMPEAEVRRYLYESVGLEPWRDSDPGGDGPMENGGRPWGVGPNYWQITQRGLSRELGYVGYYGEILDWVTAIYDATRPAPGAPGDEKILAQLVHMEKARRVFRYPGVDSDGCRAMRIEAVIGWRDTGHYPGDIAYVQRTSWDGSALGSAAVTLDAESVGSVQQMFEDNQFFALLDDRMKNNTFRVTAGLLSVPDDYELLKARPPEAHRLPMSRGQPDFVFTDEEDGVVAIKDGDDIFYASLYWRSHYAINFLAAVHYTTPTIDRIALVHEDVQFRSSGETYVRPDRTTFGFASGGPRYPVEFHSAHAGEVLPVATYPTGVSHTPGQQSVYAGRGDFYHLRYGPYLIAMNMSEDRPAEMKTPADMNDSRLLPGNQRVSAGQVLCIAPRSTLVLKIAEK